VRLRLLVLVLLALTAPGCAVVALPAVGLAAMSGGTSGAVKAGVDHTMGGSSLRTFSAPLADVRAAVRQAFRDLQIEVTQDDMLIGGAAKIEGEALRREIHVKLEPITPALTRLRMVVREGLFGRDRATAAELIEQTGRALDEIRPAGAASPRAP
jgi:hypothetical protein